MGGDGVGITKEITRKKSDVYLRAPNSDDMKFFQIFFAWFLELVMSKPQVKFHQKIFILNGRKSSDKVSHLRTIRGHLELNRCLLIGPRIVLMKNLFYNPIQPS